MSMCLIRVWVGTEYESSYGIGQVLTRNVDAYKKSASIH